MSQSHEEMELQQILFSLALENLVAGILDLLGDSEDPPPIQKELSPKQAATRLKVNLKTVYRYMSIGKLPWHLGDSQRKVIYLTDVDQLHI